MKKIYIIIFICALLAVTISMANKNQEKDNDFKTMFDRWGKGAVEDTEGTEIMNSFVDYLIENPENSSEDIQGLSPLFKVYEKDNFSIIEYIENPEFYGSSARGSYHIVMYDGRAEMIDSNGSMAINGIVKLNDHLYHIYATDYRFSNITGINIFSILINEHSIEYKPIIAKNEMIYGFTYNDAYDVLYYDNGHIYFKDIRNNGNEVVIEVGEATFLLILEEDGLYHITDQTNLR